MHYSSQEYLRDKKQLLKESTWKLLGTLTCLESLGVKLVSLGLWFYYIGCIHTYVLGLLVFMVICVYVKLEKNLERHFGP